MPQPNTLRVQFTPNYTGNHRVCWRIGTGAYDCTTIVAGITGVPVTVDIGAVDFNALNEACATSSINGYVQPTCVPETCPYLQVSFSESYDPYCRYWSLECNTSPNCAGFTLTGIDCGGVTNPVIPTSPSGTVIDFCFPSSTSITAPSPWVLTPDVECCYACNSVTIEKTSEAPVLLSYIDCASRAATPISISDYTPITICIVTGSLHVYEGTISTTDNGACPPL
jgi:hypothetical protein